MDEKHFERLEKLIRYTFTDKELLKTALTHKTYAFEAAQPVEYNERLEFLGDSILNFVIAERLYKTNSYFSEGELTRRRAVLVNNKVLSEKAAQLNLGDFLFLGKGEKLQRGDCNPTNLANALEALLGAIYLDSDLETVKTVIFQSIFSGDIQF